MENKRKKRDKIWKENGEMCAHCGHIIYGNRNKTIDHFIPKICYGSYDIRNLFPLCRACNKLKGSKLLGLDYYGYCSERKKEQAIQYGKEYNERYSSLA